MKKKRIGRRVRLLSLFRRLLGLEYIVHFDLHLKSYITVSAEFAKHEIAEDINNSELANTLARQLINSNVIEFKKGQFARDFERGTEIWTASINIRK